jgi:hypothetical protein
MDIKLKQIHSECGWHEKAILASELCGCFNCLDIFSPSQIVEWIDEPQDCPRGAGKTAMCPKCDIDTVLPDSVEGGLSINLLKAMQKEYCS